MKTIKYLILLVLGLTLGATPVFADDNSKSPAPIPTPTVVESTPVTNTPTNAQYAQNTSNQSSSSDSNYGKGTMHAGFFALGYYEINSTLDSLYYGSNIEDTNTSGLGFGGYYEYMFSDKMSAQVSAGFSRLMSTTKQRAIIEENFFIMDVVGKYYFTHSGRFHPYALLGAGIYASSGGLAPVAEVGAGTYIDLNETISLQTEVIYKTALALHRAEARIGIGFHF